MPIDSHYSNEGSNDEDDVYLYFFYSFRTHFFTASSVWASEARWCEVIFTHGIPGSRLQDPAFIISSSFCQIGTDNTEAGRLHYFLRRIGIKIYGMLLCWWPPPVAWRRDTSIKDVLASTVCPDCREDGPSLVSTWHRHSRVAFITPSLETFCCTGHRVLLLLGASHDWSGSPCQEI